MPPKQDSQTTFKTSLTWIFLSLRARYIISKPVGRPCSTMCTRCFGTQSSPGCTCTCRSKILTHSLIIILFLFPLISLVSSLIINIFRLRLCTQCLHVPFVAVVVDAALFEVTYPFFFQIQGIYLRNEQLNRERWEVDPGWLNQFPKKTIQQHCK